MIDNYILPVAILVLSIGGAGLKFSMARSKKRYKTVNILGGIFCSYIAGIYVYIIFFVRHTGIVTATLGRVGFLLAIATIIMQAILQDK
jgi:hypothetical protein